MRLHATGRDLIITEKERLISGSINIYTCEFTLDSSWDGYMVTAVFSTANRLVNKAVVDGKCEIPTEVLRPNTRLRIGIFGNDGVRTRPTTYSEWIPVEQGADTGGRTGRPPEPTVYEEWMNALDKQHDEWAKAEAEREAAEKLRGNSAVYVGSGDIPDGYNIQIDPEGEAYVDEIVDEVMKEVVPLVDAADNVFVAEYGVTTYEELEEAYYADKAMMVRTPGIQVPFYCLSQGNYLFQANINESFYNLWCKPEGTWGRYTRNLVSEKRVTALEERVTALEEGGGGGGGGDVPSIDEIVEWVLDALPTWDGGEF